MSRPFALPDLGEGLTEAEIVAVLVREGDVVAGWKNKIQTTIANVTPSGILAEQHRAQTEPGSGKEPRREREKTSAR